MRILKYKILFTVQSFYTLTSVILFKHLNDQHDDINLLQVINI